METSDNLLIWHTHNNLTYCTFPYSVVYLYAKHDKQTKIGTLLAFKYYNASLSLLSIFFPSISLSFLYPASFYIFSSSIWRSFYDNKGYFLL